MRKPVAVLLLFTLGGGLLINFFGPRIFDNTMRGVGSWAHLGSEAEDFFLMPFTPMRTNTVAITGTTGTPVLVGILLDGSRKFTYAGIIPTNFPISFRRSMLCTIKNVGTNNAQLGVNFGGGTYDAYDIPPFFGHSHRVQAKPRGYHDEYIFSMVRPVDWPQTLPPGMGQSEAKSRNFTNDFFQARLKWNLNALSRDPENASILVGVIGPCIALGMTNETFRYYERLMNTDCPNPHWLNSGAYDYICRGGTNIDLAYSAALKAHLALPNEWAFKDTVGWALVSRGDYEKALSWFVGNEPIVLYHKGVAHYMVMQEETAEGLFRSVLRGLQHAPEALALNKMLQILAVNPNSPREKNIALLRARLTEEPEDPVALSRLAQIYGRNQSGADGLVYKALAFSSFRQQEYYRAVEDYSQALKTRTNDPDVFYYLGLAYKALGRSSESEDALRSALTLGLKPAQAEAARRLIDSKRKSVSTSN